MNGFTIPLPHITGKKNEYSIKVYTRYRKGKYSKFGIYKGTMKYVHYNRVNDAIRHLKDVQGLSFNFVEIIHRKTGQMIGELFL